MAWRIIKQPNGNLARFTDVADGFTDFNLSHDDAINLCLQKGMSQENAEVKVKAGELDYEPWTVDRIGDGLSRWRDAISTVKRVHGEVEAYWSERYYLRGTDGWYKFGKYQFSAADGVMLMSVGEVPF